MGLFQGFGFFPCLRDQQGFDLWQFAMRADQNFEHPIQGCGIRATGLNNRFDVIDIGTQLRIIQLGFVAFHPVDVAVDRIDLTIMGQNTERLGQRPAGECIGRIALMVDRKIRREPLVIQIRIERGQLFCQEQSLIDHRSTA